MHTSLQLAFDVCSVCAKSDTGNGWWHEVARLRLRNCFVAGSQISPNVRVQDELAVIGTAVPIYDAAAYDYEMVAL